MVGGGDADRCRRLVGRAGDVGQPRQRLYHQVLAGAVHVGAIRAKSGRSRIDDARVDGAGRLVAETELVHDAWAKILADHVRRGDQLLDQRTALGRLEVHRQGALVAIAAELQHGFAVDPAVGAAPFALEGAVGRFDADDIGAEVGQNLRADRAEQKVIEAEHANSVEHVGHGL